MAEQAHPYSLSPESSRPKAMHLPAYGDTIVPNEIVIEEKFDSTGGMPEYPDALVVADRVNTIVATGTGEVRSRSVRMAPKLLIDPNQEHLITFREQVSLYHEAADPFDWLLDNRGIYLAAKPGGDKPPDVFPFLPEFYMIAGRGAMEVTHLEESPPLGQVERDRETGYLLMQHGRMPNGQILFEKLIHIHYGPGSRVLPFYGGVRYDPRLREYPFLTEVLKKRQYDPHAVRALVAPFLLIGPMALRPA